MRRLAVVTLAVVLAFFGSIAFADGVFIAAPNRTDMVHDPARNLIYIANGDRVERYDIAGGCLLDPIVLGGSLKGIDLSADGKTLAVADGSDGGATDWDHLAGQVYLIDTDTLQETKLEYPAPTEWGEFGTFSVAFMSDGDLLVSSRFAGSGWVDLRRLDPVTHVWSAVTTSVDVVRQDTMLAPSGNGRVIGFAESNISDGSWGVYDVATGGLVRRQSYENGTSAFNYEMTVNATGTQFAIPTYGGTLVYDANYQVQTRLGGYPEDHPIGGAYHPVEPQAFFPWEGTREVRVYDMRDFALLGSYDFEDDFVNPGNVAFVQGRTRLSRDGSLLMVSVTGGVRYLRLYDPLGAQPLSLASTDGRVTARLQGSVGNGGKLSYSLWNPPAHGRVVLDGDQATYIPAVGYQGEDAFDYAVHYGQAVATARVSVSVIPVGSSYTPRVSLQTLPALQVATPIPGSTRVPGDFNGDKTSDPLWFNPQTSRVGYWSITSVDPFEHAALKSYKVTPGYVVGAVGDLSGDGYADLVFVNAHRDVWMWTNTRTGGWRSTRIGSYTAGWQLVGSGDVDGDGYDDLLWVNPSQCRFYYWLMKGDVRRGSGGRSVACGYYPVGLGYYTPSRRISILWVNSINSLYVWDSVPGGFSSHNLTGITSLQGGHTVAGVWAIGGGVSGKGMGFEWQDSTGNAYGAALDRNFDSSGKATGYSVRTLWQGSGPMATPASGGYLVRGASPRGTSIYVLNTADHRIGAYGISGSDPAGFGNAPIPTDDTWGYTNGWYLVGAPANGSAVFPWR